MTFNECLKDFAKRVSLHYTLHNDNIMGFFVGAMYYLPNGNLHNVLFIESITTRINKIKSTTVKCIRLARSATHYYQQIRKDSSGKVTETFRWNCSLIDSPGNCQRKTSATKLVTSHGDNWWLSPFIILVNFLSIIFYYLW